LVVIRSHRADAWREVVVRMLEEPPDSDRVYVPLCDAGCGVSLRLFRDQGGERCAVGFTRLERLVELLGRDQRYYRLTIRSVRELAGQREVTRLLLDPALVAAPVRSTTQDWDLEPAALAHAAAVHTAANGTTAVHPTPVHAAPTRTAPVGELEPARLRVPAGRGHRPLHAVRTAWEHSQAAGILVVSAGAGAAALVLEALK
jgi:hypothetical protein